MRKKRVFLESFLEDYFSIVLQKYLRRRNLEVKEFVGER
jgi:hypothetical protein